MIYKINTTHADMKYILKLFHIVFGGGESTLFQIAIFKKNDILTLISIVYLKSCYFFFIHYLYHALVFKFEINIASPLNIFFIFKA